MQTLPPQQVINTLQQEGYYCKPIDREGYVQLLYKGMEVVPAFKTDGWKLPLLAMQIAAFNRQYKHQPQTRF